MTAKITLHTLVATALAVTFENNESAEKQAAGCDGHEDDRVSVSGLSFGRGGGSVVLTLRTALRLGCRCNAESCSDQQNLPEV
jgi:hypothetical protein